MSVDVSFVLVSFRSSAVVPTAVTSFRANASKLGVRAEVVLVDHSDDGAEVAALRHAQPEILLERANRGYAAGINAGVAASNGGVVLVGNPDVALGVGALEALLGAIRAGWDVVGPQFVLAGFLLPPADRQTPREELLRWLATRSQVFWHRYFRSELRRWRRVWGATETVAQETLSGALLAFRRETFNRVGVWDEDFFLYFEETEWLRRALACGMRVGLVPAARVEHLWGHTADPGAYRTHFVTSRNRFLTRGFGWAGHMASRLQMAGTPLRPLPFPEEYRTLPSGRLLWLVSPTPLGFPAASFEGEAAEFWSALRTLAAERAKPASYVALAVQPERGSVLGVWSVEAGRV